MMPMIGTRQSFKLRAQPFGMSRLVPVCLQQSAGHIFEICRQAGNESRVFAVTVMRIWMEIHDRKTYKTVWEEVQRLVLKLTRKKLKFKGLHRGEKILGLNSDMEAAPLLGFAATFVGTVDLEDICYSHFNRTMSGWWDHKLKHHWLLRGLIQCLSNIPLEQWKTMEATTNLGEAQHAWNNTQTGISMGVIVESFKKHEELDVRRAEEIEIRKSTAIPQNARNEVSQRYANRTTRQTRNSDKARFAHAAESDVAALEVELSETREELAAARSDVKAELSAETTRRVRELEATVTVEIEGKLKLARAEAKSSSSGRVRAPRASASAATSNATSPPASGSGPAPVPGATAALLTISSVAADAMDSDIASGRRVSAHKRAQADLSSTAPASSNKRQKKLEDPLAIACTMRGESVELYTGRTACVSRIVSSLARVCPTAPPRAPRAPFVRCQAVPPTQMRNAFKFGLGPGFGPGGMPSLGEAPPRQCLMYSSSTGAGSPTLQSWRRPPKMRAELNRVKEIVSALRCRPTSMEMVMTSQWRAMAL
ncbi:hypothetical protein K438DRAFT_1764966 [Mycena galopus ATCC 62051]|nr:hypothetical protein K438DRAFT_1764966 [Mycena galopus ATCC 62051]